MQVQHVAVLIWVMEELEQWFGQHGFPFISSGINVSYLFFFADDAIIYCRTEAADVACLKSLLQSYELGSGQRINLDKSAAFFSPLLPARLRQQLVASIGIREQVGYRRYLGF